MKMAKKLVSVLLAVLLVFSLATTCFASSSEQETTEEAVLIKSNGEREYGSLKGLLAKTYAYGTNVTVQLLKDITYQAENVEVADPIYASYGVGGEDGVRCNLDLGGHTITVTANLDSNCISFWAIYVPQYSCEIRNGTIAADVNSSGKCSETYFAGYQIAEIYTSTTFKNVVLMSDSEHMDHGICFSEGWGSSTDSRTLSLDNVTVVSEGTAIECKPGTPSGGTSKELKININSGSFKNLNLGEGEGYSVTYGTPLTVPGTNNGTSVYTSADTTAIIVDDGNAYLYDTLQDAVDDAAKRTDTESVTIHLLKQPESTVQLPENIPDDVTLSKLGENSTSIDFDSININDADGNKVTVGDNGNLIFTIDVDSVTLDKTSLDLTVGDSATLNAKVEPENATYPTVIWTSSNPNVATVDSTGKVTALKPGTAKITASAGGKTATCTVTVSREPVIPEPNGITVTQPANGTLKVNPSNGSAGTLITVTATPDKGYELAYITVDGEKISGNTFRMPDKAVTVSAVFVTSDFPFVDVKPGDWHYDYIAYVYENGLMNGVSATTFEPNANMTRAMVWTILARIDGETVTGANWIDTARAWAMAEGVSDGTNPNGLVTREQFATMLYRYAVAKGYDVSIGESTNILSYADYDEISEWAIPAMQWACGSGIITGVTESTLVPQGTATRAQCAAMLMRFMEL